MKESKAWTREEVLSYHESPNGIAENKVLAAYRQAITDNASQETAATLWRKYEELMRSGPGMLRIAVANTTKTEDEFAARMA
jgi:hypothetical protein